MEMITTTVNIFGDNNVENKNINKSRNKCRSIYAVNTIIVVLLTLFTFGLDLGFIAERKAGFYCKDPLLSYKFIGDTVYTGTLHLVHLLVPPLLFYIVETLGRYKRRSLRDVRFVWSWYLDIIIGMLFTLAMTQTCKVLSGSLRPHFFDTCLPDTNENCTVGTFLTNYECTNQNSSRALILETTKSFPSGHSSLSTFVSIYCATYIIIRLRNKSLEKLVKPLIVTLFVSWGLAVPLTRVADHRHHWWDVLIGCLLGTLGAIYTIKYLSMSFKSPSSKKEHMSTGSDCI